ncbi:alpha/beta fold hydrolase [Actinomadura keratinilytica]
MPTATLHDGTRIAYEIHGSGPALLLPVDPVPKEGARAEELRRWGMDPALGRTLADGLGDAFQVIAFDYEGHRMRHPAAALTPDHLAVDLLAVADAAGAGRFAYYGYSWLALAGLQLALRTDRLAALAMGGFPPLGGPYAQMLRVTAAAHAMAQRPKTPAGSGGEGVRLVQRGDRGGRRPDRPVPRPLPGARRIRRGGGAEPDRLPPALLRRIGGRDPLRTRMGWRDRRHGRP